MWVINRLRLLAFGIVIAIIGVISPKTALEAIDDLVEGWSERG